MLLCCSDQGVMLQHTKYSITMRFTKPVYNNETNLTYERVLTTQLINRLFLLNIALQVAHTHFFSFAFKFCLNVLIAFFSQSLQNLIADYRLTLRLRMRFHICILTEKQLNIYTLVKLQLVQIIFKCHECIVFPLGK